MRFLPNLALRDEGLLAVRDGDFGEQLETFHSRAFAVCDHQHAHVYVRDAADVPLVRAIVSGLPGVERSWADAERGEIGLDHERAGEIILQAAPDAWFAYPFWLDDARAPDYARTVDIHRKPGYDPLRALLRPQAPRPEAPGGPEARPEETRGSGP